MTIKDIAKICGVSVSTVSRVLNHHPDVQTGILQEECAEILKNFFRELRRK